ncbi:MAG: hypothetical protein A2Z88_07475 [Omnitrophica WOR_2 bacterium GWA2_47_8]|nr:MAG: hypothetical protein A2Z88_07475 [Omnitrophica WOR_2 bacterium GWA2_47_8]
MPLKFIYGLIFGILGAIVGFFAFLLLMTLVGFLMDFFLGSGLWPFWSKWPITGFSILGILGILSIAIKAICYGFKFGENAGRDPHAPVFKKYAAVFFILTLSVFACVIYMVMLYTRARSMFPDSAVSSRSGRIVTSQMGFYVNVGKEGLNAVVNILESSPDPHRLRLRFIALNSTEEEVIKEISNDVHLDFEKQRFIFDITFEDLAKGFYDNILKGKPPEAGEGSISKDILIQARLQGIGEPPPDPSSPLSPRYPEDSFLDLRASLNLDCGEEKCSVVELDLDKR